MLDKSISNLKSLLYNSFICFRAISSMPMPSTSIMHRPKQPLAIFKKQRKYSSSSTQSSSRMTLFTSTGWPDAVSDPFPSSLPNLHHVVSYRLCVERNSLTVKIVTGLLFWRESMICVPERANNEDFSLNKV